MKGQKRGLLFFGIGMVVLGLAYFAFGESVTLTTQVGGAIIPPVGSIIAWHKSYANTPQPLPEGWVECDGQQLNDPDSEYNGQTIPNLNGEGRFLRGNATSGMMEEATSIYEIVGYGYTVYIDNDDGIARRVSRDDIGELSGKLHVNRRFYKVRPVNMSVVWIMRVK